MSSTRTAYGMLVESRTFIVLDVETCPDPTDGGHIISIAALTFKSGRQRGTWATLIDPQVPITNSQDHGLTDADVIGKPTFDEVVGQLDDLLAGDDVMLVCHHAAFDVGHLHLEHARVGGHLRDLPVLDTMDLPKALGYKIGRSRKLAAFCDHFGIVNRNPHDAAADAAATGEVLLAFLRVAANEGFVDAGDVWLATKARMTAAISPYAAGAAKRRRDRSELPADHLTTHTSLLPATPTDAELDDWAFHAVECARLRCQLLEPKARTAVDHAAGLHPRLTAALAAEAAGFLPGQGATLVGALNTLVSDVAVGRPANLAAWWKQHGATVRHLARCSELGSCAACREGDPCPLDVAHHAIARAYLQGPDDRISQQTRRNFRPSNSSGRLTSWTAQGLHDLAGYGAWLVIDSYLAEGNDPMATGLLDAAVQAGASDPRLSRLLAQRHAAQARTEDVERLVAAALTNRNTDPGYEELQLWSDRWQAQRDRRPAPRNREGADHRFVRPDGRVRPRRFAVDR